MPGGLRGRSRGPAASGRGGVAESGAWPIVFWLVKAWPRVAWVGCVLAGGLLTANAERRQTPALDVFEYRKKCLQQARTPPSLPPPRWGCAATGAPSDADPWGRMTVRGDRVVQRLLSWVPLPPSWTRREPLYLEQRLECSGGLLERCDGD